jgi:TATA-box binding protein (TBP) (component of TFIID and TFIIIB)
MICMQPSSVCFKLRNPKAYARVFASGKYVCMGGKSTVDAVTIARRVTRKVQRIPEYHDVGFYAFSLNNISASGAFGYRIALRALSEDPAFSDYTESVQKGTWEHFVLN